MLRLTMAVVPDAAASDRNGQLDRQSENRDLHRPSRRRHGVAPRFRQVRRIGENLHRDRRVARICGWTKDAFHFAWTKAEGDLTLAADVSFVGPGKNPHRKACLMIRQSLDADAAYVDVAVHGDGLTSLQFREAKGAATHEVQANVSAPARVAARTSRQIRAARTSAERTRNCKFSGAAVRIAFDEPFYVGLGVCSPRQGRDGDGRLLERRAATRTRCQRSRRRCCTAPLETQSIASTDRRVVHVTPTRIEAPNWLRGRQDADLQQRRPDLPHPRRRRQTGTHRHRVRHSLQQRPRRLAGRHAARHQRPVASATASRASTPFRSPAGSQSSSPRPAPSYWHGWSPDGKTLVYCAERDGEFDIYTIPVDGGEETRLTTAKGLDDGPEYSPDGK